MKRQIWILNERLRDIGLSRNSPVPFFVAGGALTSVFSNKQINDLDLFFYKEEDFKLMEADFVKRRLEGEKIIITAETDNAVSYVVNEVRVQLIKKVFGAPKEIIKQFDFTICMAAYDPQTETIIMDDNFLYHLAQRTLYLNTELKYPIATLWRVKKYLKRDFSLPAIEIIKLALIINNLKIETFGQLKEQLEGIDTYFLRELTDALINKENEVFDFKEALEFMDKILSEKMGWSDEGGEL